MRSRSCCLICRSFPRIRLRIVLRFTVKNPFPFFPLMCANPRNRTSRALPHPFVSGSVRHTARTRSGAFYLDEVPAQTSPAVPEGSLGKTRASGVPPGTLAPSAAPSSSSPTVWSDGPFARKDRVPGSRSTPGTRNRKRTSQYGATFLRC